MCNNSSNWGSPCCKGQSDKNIKAKDIRACCVRSKDIVADDFCTQDAQVKHLEVEQEVVNDLCAQSVSAKQLFAEKEVVNDLCARSATINELCVDNLTVQGFQNCNKYRASVGFAVDFLNYPLSTPINFTTIFDDPNNSIAFGPTRYIAPITGYYMATLTLSVKNLKGANTIAGVPTSQMDILINGIKVKASFTPFLTFLPAQEGFVSSLLQLNAGDTVSWNYEVLVVDPVTGLTAYVGTVDLVGGAIGSGVVSSFQIINISAICDDSSAPGACAQCPIVDVPCVPVETPCEPMDHGCDDGSCTKPNGMDGFQRVKAILKDPAAPIVVSNCSRRDGNCPSPAPIRRVRN
jgi:hypothetical protein